MSKSFSGASALIPVFSGNLNNTPTLLCNARNLHAFLRVGRAFTHWIKERIAEYGFVDGEDFCLPNLASKRQGRGGHNRIDYHLTLDTAKELAMVERNEQGRTIRRYFIECERRAMAKAPVPHQRSSEYLENRDTANIRRIVTLIAARFRYRDIWSRGIWKALRDVTGVPASKRLEVRHLPQIAVELQRIFRASEVLHAAIEKAEKQVLKRVVRSHEDFDAVIAEAERLLEVAAEGHRAEMHRFSDGAMQLGINRLLARKEP